jgi:type II secretory ATPase GspE/PulE/Tfp pilus assembly ATPase PilB-like protein
MIDKQFEDLPKKFKDELEFTNEVYEPTPTPESASGTKGRIAVMEMFPMDKDIESIILKNANEVEIAKVVREKGMLTMKEDAILKAMHKVIPWAEVNEF